VDYKIWGIIQERVHQTPLCDVDDLKQHRTDNSLGCSSQEGKWGERKLQRVEKRVSRSGVASRQCSGSRAGRHRALSKWTATARVKVGSHHAQGGPKSCTSSNHHIVANLLRKFNSYIKMQPKVYFLKLQEHFGKICFIFPDWLHLFFGPPCVVSGCQ